MRMSKTTLGIIVGGTAVPRWIYETILNLSDCPKRDIRLIVIPDPPAKGIFATDGKIGRTLDKLPSLFRRVLGRGRKNAFKAMDIRSVTERSFRDNNAGYDQLDQVLSLIGPVPDSLLAKLRYAGCGIAILSVQSAYLRSVRLPQPDDYSVPGNGLALFEYERGDFVFSQDISTRMVGTDGWILNNLCEVLPDVIPELLLKTLTVDREPARHDKLEAAKPLQRKPIGLSAGLERKLKYAIGKFKSPPRWELMFTSRNRDIHDLSTYRRIQPPRDTEWADPFAVDHEGKSYVFYEDFPYRSSPRAHLSAAEIRPDGSLKVYEKIIVEPFHLSYPQVFRIHGEIYMLPETSQDKSLRIYRCLRFPDRWVLEKRLLEGKDFADSTLYYSEDRYWLFTSHSNGSEGHNSNLYLYSAADPFSDEWVPHPENPIHTDIRRSRMAGPIYEKDGKRYRLSQYSEHHYGEAVNFNEIIELNERSYREIPVDRLGPSEHPRIAGVHTFTETANVRFVDVLRKR